MNTWSPGQTLEDIDKRAVLECFHYFLGNKVRTAAALKIAVRTLDAYLEKYLATPQIKSEVSIAERTPRRANKALFERTEAIIKGLQTPARIPMEPAIETATQRAVPMPEREKTKEMLFIEDAKNDAPKRNLRKTVNSGND